MLRKSLADCRYRRLCRSREGWGFSRQDHLSLGQDCLNPLRSRRQKTPCLVPVQWEGAHEQGHHDLGHEGAGQEGDGQQGHLTRPRLLDVAQLHIDALHDFWNLEAAVSRGKAGPSEKQRGDKKHG